MTSTIKRTLSRTLASAFCLVANVSTAFALDLGTPPSELTGDADIETGVVKVVEAILKLMALVATIVIIIAGIRMLISQGDESAVEKAKKAIIWAILGLIVILIAGAIVNIVVGVS